MFPGSVPSHEWRPEVCENCGLARSSRLDIPEGTYERIYSAGVAAGGYSGYQRWARISREHRRPWPYLCRREMQYGFVQRAMEHLELSDGSILDYGCGLGYVVGALRKEGLTADGTDIALTALDQARSSFGDHFYTAEDLTAQQRQYDLVVNLEVIEHVADPEALVRGLISHVAPGGHFLISTPTRPSDSPIESWISDRPPIHLYWFTVSAMHQLLERCGAEVVDTYVTDASTPPELVEAQAVVQYGLASRVTMTKRAKIAAKQTIDHLAEVWPAASLALDSAQRRFGGRPLEGQMGVLARLR